MWQKLLGGGIALALLLYGFSRLLHAEYQRGRLDEKIEWTEATRDATAKAAQGRIEDGQRYTDAVVALATSWQQQEPVILHSKETVRDYAKTADGSGPCLPADRVLGIEATASALGLQTGAGADADDPAEPAPPVPDDPIRNGP